MKKIIFLVIFLLIAAGVIYFIGLKSPTKSPDTALNRSARSEESYVISKGPAPSIPFQLPDGYVVHIFASGLGSARDLQFTPAGTLLTSDPSRNTVIALPDNNNDGIADEEKIIISEGDKVHGLTFYNNYLFVAQVDKVVRYNWNEDTLTASSKKNLFSLPQNYDHNNRTIVFDKVGMMFVSVGSTCNVCREQPTQGGSIFISDQNGQNKEVYATGLRNAAFLAINPITGQLWATEMGRDNLGDNIPPDEINIIKQNQNYGWPDCYGSKVPDKLFNKGANCQNTISPIFEIPAHSAPLGLAFIESQQFPSSWQGDLLVAYHGSWNRSTAIGYKIVHLNVTGDKITGSQDFMTGFNIGTKREDSLGRPADVAFDSKGNLYISDDKTGTIYIVQKEK
jgi:glucose/arabinose dehydrogenase